MTTWRHEWMVRWSKGIPVVEHRWFNRRRGGDCLIVYYDRPGWDTHWYPPPGVVLPDRIVHRERKRAWRKR